MRVELAADHPELIPTVALWHWQWWGESAPGGSLDAWTIELESFAQRDGLPMLLIALTGSMPVGSVSLVEHDMTSAGTFVDSTPPIRWRNLTPWLSSLYVVPDHRRRGVGRALVDACAVQAARLGAERLYLYTTTVEFYLRVGWVLIGRDRYEGDEITIMVKDLTPQEVS